MLTIRSLILDGVALLGIVVGVAAGVGGYLHDATAKVATASPATSGPDTTGPLGLEGAVTKPNAWTDQLYRRLRQ